MKKWPKNAGEATSGVQLQTVVLEQPTTLKHSSSAQSRHLSAPNHFKCPSRTFLALEHW